MADDKNVRDWDRILLRVPDGLKERVTQRASASGRSVNSEIIAMLEQVLGTPADAEFQMLTNEAIRLTHELNHTRTAAAAAEARLDAVRSELRKRIGREVSDEELPDIAMRMVMVRKVRERKALEAGE